METQRSPKSQSESAASEGRPISGNFNIAVTNRQTVLPLDLDDIRAAVRTVLDRHSVPAASVHVALVDDREIRQLNRQFLDHDYATDVLSFCYEAAPELDGELIIGAERALRVATEKGTHALDELIWYVVHGTLHLLGYDDATDELRAAMREEERRAMQFLGRGWPLENGAHR